MANCDALEGWKVSDKEDASKKVEAKASLHVCKFIQPYGNLYDIIIDSKSGKMPRVTALHQQFGQIIIVEALPNFSQGLTFTRYLVEKEVQTHVHACIEAFTYIYIYSNELQKLRISSIWYYYKRLHQYPAHY